ncbi:MAG: polyphosphate kinase 1 [Acidobacteria bacterium]|nr:polyphosphate kinase 1 [Acidobacteriota bacterium]
MQSQDTPEQQVVPGQAHSARARATRAPGARANGSDPAAKRGRTKPPVDLHDPSLYINRELSLLAFQSRVLEEAQDESNPLLERVSFLAIVGSNLDEFFMVRVAGLMRQLEAGATEPGADGLTPAEQLDAIRTAVGTLVSSAQRCLHQKLLPALDREGIRFIEYPELNGRQRQFVDRYFSDVVFPVLTPLAFDPGRPFPHISNLSVNLAVLIRDTKGEERFARVKVPDTLPQIVAVERASTKKTEKTQAFIWLEDLITAHLQALFPGMEILESHAFHVTRNADIEIQELEAGDLLETTEQGLRRRRFGDVVRLQVGINTPRHMMRILIKNLEVDRKSIYRIKGRLSFSRLRHLAAIERPDLKWPGFVPAVPPPLDENKEDEDMFATIRRRDILFHHPFDSFTPVVELLDQAAHDNSVLTVKMTLYRVGRNSPIIAQLLHAIEDEKQVAAMVELKARFDEGSNIEWAKALEKEGGHVVYGLPGLKVHAKAALIVRNEGEEIRRYVHLGTGNYNPVTAHAYTDVGLFTADEDFGADVTDLFNFLTGYSAKKDYRKLLVAPINLRGRFEELIAQEIRHQAAGGNGRMILKMNALTDERMIRRLYEASQAGVKVDLLVRGMCCLKPGISGVSENIRVISVVGRFLEHSRIYYFHNGGDPLILAGSADLMERNLDRRVEVLFPIEDRRLIRHLHEKVLELYLSDNVKAREMLPDGRYLKRKRPPGSPRINAQEEQLSRRAGNGRG